MGNIEIVSIFYALIWTAILFGSIVSLEIARKKYQQYRVTHAYMIIASILLTLMYTASGLGEAEGAIWVAPAILSVGYILFLFFSSLYKLIGFHRWIYDRNVQKSIIETKHTNDQLQTNAQTAYYEDLKRKVKRAGSLAVIFGWIQIAFAVLIAILGLAMSMSDADGALIFAFAIIIAVLLGVFGAVFVVLGARIQNLNDTLTKTYLWILLVLSCLALFSGAGLLLIILLVFLIIAISSWNKLSTITEFRNHLTAPYYQFSGVWWAVLLVPSTLIMVIAVMALGQSGV